MITRIKNFLLTLLGCNKLLVFNVDKPAIFNGIRRPGDKGRVGKQLLKLWEAKELIEQANRHPGCKPSLPARIEEGRLRVKVRNAMKYATYPDGYPSPELLQQANKEGLSLEVMDYLSVGLDHSLTILTTDVGYVAIETPIKPIYIFFEHPGKLTVDFNHFRCCR